MWDDSTLGLLFLFLLLYRHIWKIYVYPCFYQSPLSNLYLTLYLVQVGSFKEIQHYRYSCCLMCIPLWYHFFLPSIETITILNLLLIIFKLFLFCSYMHVYECIKYIALFHMLKILKIYTLFYMYTYNIQLILKHFFLYKISSWRFVLARHASSFIHLSTTLYGFYRTNTMVNPYSF